MGIFDKTDYYGIGKTGTVDKFTRTFQSAGTGKKKDLTEGAVQAFREGRPENIQAVLSESNIFNAHLYAYTLHRLSEGSDDKAAAIDLAFAKAPEQVKKEVLDKVLTGAVKNGYFAEDSFVAALLKSGADANLELDGFAGGLLALAVYLNRPASIVKLLRENGASVEGAISRARAKNYASSYIKMLEMCQTKAEGKPAAEDVSPQVLEVVLQMQEQMRALTERVSDLTEEVKNLKSPPAATPVKKKAPPKPRAYPTLKGLQPGKP